MSGELTWIAGLRRTYLGNATATRDMRVQLRGSRAAVLFTIYLVVMTFVLLMVYSSSLDGGQNSLAAVQSSLQSFYYTTLGALAVVITLVAPNMGAFAIVSEKQRRSLDLVFSAPTEPKYYLVGKLISSYRFVWLLLVLSLPFCAVSVTLGGTTWSQLFITFLLYSMYGLVCVSFGLLMSTLCNKVLPAIIWTYAALGCYLVFTAILFAAGSASRGAMTNINPVFSLNPACYSFIADQTWPIFGKEIPTWILSILMHLLVVKFIILAAGSMIAPGNSKEIRGLRIHSLIYAAALFFLFSMSMAPFFVSILGTGAATSFGTLRAQEALQVYYGRALFSLLFGLGIIVVPYLASFGFNDLRRHRPDGMFKISQTFTGRPSGHLPFIGLLFILSTVAFCLGGWYSAGATPMFSFGFRTSTLPAVEFNPLSLYFLMYVFLILGIWLTAFFIGWYACSRTPILSRGRTVSLFFFVLGIILPTAIFAILAGDDSRSATGVWALNPVAGVLCDVQASKMTGLHGVILACIAVLLVMITIPGVVRNVLQNPDNRSEDRNDSNKKIPAV
jgi:ABC-type transport system involved in multi-copper enzyme maturation permease subunit